MKAYFFTSREFDRNGQAWFENMDCGLLTKLDVIRHMWGKPIRISGNRMALGRHLGDSYSQHNIDRWQLVKAADVQPEGITEQEDAYRFYLLARDVGFTGIGFYPHWTDGAGFHLDVRSDRKPGDPAEWGRVDYPNRVYVSMSDAIEAFV